MKYSGLLSNAVDEALGALGRLPKDVIYEVLKIDFCMQKADIPVRFVEFSSILRDNIGPSAEPLLGFIIDRFYHEIRVESVPCIDLDESISRVNMILKGDLARSDDGNHVSRKRSTLPNRKASKETCDSIRLTRNQINSPYRETSIPISTTSQEQSERASRRIRNRPCSKIASGI